DYGFNLCLLRFSHSELVERLLEIIEKGLPLGRRDHKILVRVLHGAAGVLLRSTGSPAEHFRNEVFEACRGNAMMGLVYLWVRVQAGIDHDPIDKVIDHGGDAVAAMVGLTPPLGRDQFCSAPLWTQGDEGALLHRNQVD